MNLLEIDGCSINFNFGANTISYSLFACNSSSPPVPVIHGIKDYSSYETIPYVIFYQIKFGLLSLAVQFWLSIDHFSVQC